VYLCAVLFIPFVLQGQSLSINLDEIDMQGHRGARGLMPENTIPAFIRAIEEGVNTLELDVVISKDKQVVVSHEPYMSAAICTKPNGDTLSRAESEALNMYHMTYEQISQFDCGSIGNERFPSQEKVAVYKPLLSAVIQAVELYTEENSLSPLAYNIELKSQESGDGIDHPEVAEFSFLVKELLDEYLPKERYTIQSFDFRVLQYWYENYPDVRLVALVENLKSIENNIKNLGFKPHVYSPYYKLLDEDKIKICHQMGMKVIPWTVNDLEEIRQLIRDGVDGIITDYPNLISELKN
jgi:glycerophosphoryl diester phosphodiesterase